MSVAACASLSVSVFVPVPVAAGVSLPVSDTTYHEQKTFTTVSELLFGSVACDSLSSESVLWSTALVLCVHCSFCHRHPRTAILRDTFAFEKSRSATFRGFVMYPFSEFSVAQSMRSS